jgi:MoaA/NifB/PqqE/SkfB family radical SAM enzyme
VTRSQIRPLVNLLQGRPVLAVFEVCLRCNSDCGYCGLPLNVGRYELSRAEIGRIFAALYEYGMRFVFVQGGEPLLRRDLLDVLQDFSDLGYSLTLITNGTRLTPAIVSRLEALAVNISVSLDTLDAVRYRRIRGADQLEQVLQGIALLKDYPHPKFVTCIVSEVNREEVPSVARFARERGFIPVIGAYHWGIARYGKIAPSLQYDRQTVSRVFAEILDSGLVPRGYFRRYLKDNVRWLSGKPLPRCDAGRFSIAIDASGNVSPCLALPHAGNLRESSLPDILARLDRHSIAECSNRSSCNMLCSRVVGSLLRHPVSALLTPTAVKLGRRTAT